MASYFTWTKAWNNIIRYVLFQDEELKSLMQLPQNTNIIDFIDKYFIRGITSSQILTNETVRVIYGNINTNGTASPSVTNNVLSFEIYVKNEEMHNVSNDRLEMRTEAISNRLTYLLTRNEYVKSTGYKFKVFNQSDMFTSTVGYSRYNVAFTYMKTV